MDLCERGKGVIAFDLNTVGVDLGPVPVDEVLDFRKQNLSSKGSTMSGSEAFSIENRRRRLQEASERLNELCVSLANFADEFLNPLTKTGATTEIIEKMADTMPETLLVRALAEEGIALIEQIRWEAYILGVEEGRPSSADTSKLTVAAQKVKSWADSLEEQFMLTRDQMNQLLQTVMKLREDFVETVKEIGDLIPRPQKE